MERFRRLKVLLTENSAIKSGGIKFKNYQEDRTDETRIIWKVVGLSENTDVKRWWP